MVENIDYQLIENRDYTLIIDRSGSMAIKDKQAGKSRWKLVEESTLALAMFCEDFDPDGITVYTFSTKSKRYENVTSRTVEDIFKKKPIGRTELAAVLKEALDDYFKRKEAGQAKQNGEIILVITDGKPDYPEKVIEVIIEATKKIDKDEELGISMIQVGNDPEATKFLEILDDDLKNAGAKFDIVNKRTIKEIEEEELTLEEVLLKAIKE